MNENNAHFPTVALGTWAWGDSGQAGEGYFGSTLTDSGLKELAAKAQANGLTLWDTATVYGMGHSEKSLASALQSFDRTEYQLSTKFTPQIAGSDEDPVRSALDQSLANLRTDYVDLYWIHNPADVERWTPTLIPLLRSGKVRHVGVSNHDVEQIRRADTILRGSGFRVSAVQNHYSLLYRSSEKAGVLDYCRERGIRFFSYMVLEQGALTGKYGPRNPMPAGSSRAAHYNHFLPQLQALTDRLAELGEAHGASAADVAIAWAIAKGTTPIIGVTKDRYVDGIVRALSTQLLTEEIEALEILADEADVDTRGGWEHAME